jgi:hypothetical protein
MSGGLVLVTGPSGAGKSALCRALIVAARRAGRDVAGLLCPAAFAGGGKIGIEVLDLRSGELRRLARRRTAADDETTSRRWIFDEAVLAWGNDRLAAATPCDLLVVDELGPLELEEGRGWSAGLAAVDSGAYATALVVVRPGLLARARARWPRAGIAEASAPGVRERLAARLAGGTAP